MSNFTYKGKYREYKDCFFRTGYYENGNLAVEIWSAEDGPITKVTVNPGLSIYTDHIAIKDYSENEGMVSWLISEGLIEDTPTRIIVSGFVEIPVHKLTEKGKSFI